MGFLSRIYFFGNSRTRIENLEQFERNLQKANMFLSKIINVHNGVDYEGIAFRLPAGLFSYSKHPDRLYFPRSPPNQWIPLFTRGKSARNEADHSYPPSSEVMNEWSYTSAPKICLRSLHRDITFMNNILILAD
jgi:hypothetical protein